MWIVKVKGVLSFGLFNLIDKDLMTVALSSCWVFEQVTLVLKTVVDI